MIIESYIVYLVITISVTIWVARTLHKNGRVFLVDAFGGNEAMADSVNHLLVVGFYLINVGYVAVALRFGTKPATLDQVCEYLSSKIGVVLLVLGAMHFLNLKIFSSFRRRAMLGMRPPVAPATRIAPPVVG